MKNGNNKLSLLDKWKKKSKEKSAHSTIEKMPDDLDIPLSPGQRRLWFLQQLYPDNPFYNYSETYNFNGKLNIDFLVASLKYVYQDHDILRTTYKVVENVPIQIIDNEASIAINVHDLSAYNIAKASSKAQAIMKKDATTHFDLTKSPLVKTSIIKIAEEQHILQITLHHIITDKWSMRLFREHIATYYTNLIDGLEVVSRRKEIQYTDYCYWFSQKKINTSTLNYWKTKLAGEIPQITLPFDFNRPLVPSFKGAASFTQEYSSVLSQKILELSKTLSTTPYNLMLAVYYTFLYRCSGQTDILVGTPITNRDQKTLEELIGFFNNTLVLRVEVDPNASFIDLISNVKHTTLEAFENKDLPFDVLVKEMNLERSLSTNPFFQVMFLYHSKPENPSFGDNLTLSHTWYDSDVAKFDLTIYVGEDNGILSTTFEYAHDLFEESTINRFQDYFKSLLEHIATNPSQCIADIPMLTKDEEVLLSNYETTYSNDFDTFKGIHNIIEVVAKSKPKDIAVSYDDTSITYFELDTKASALTQHILSLDIEPNAVVGLCIERSSEMIIGMLGILKAGCCYLPLDPDYPRERLDFILKDSNTELIVTESQNSYIFKDLDCKIINIEDIPAAQEEIIALPTTSKADLAYIIYTSGSTGKPKGVPITHGNIINSTAGRLDFYDQNPKAFLLMSSISFDSSKAGIFWTLCTGGNLVISEKRIEQDIDAISAIINKQSITHTLMLPSLYNLVLEYSNLENLKSLNTVIVAGEACPISLCKSHFNTLPKVNLYNEYGPTEGTVWCIAHKVTINDLNRKSIPIGKPVANSKVYILDKNFNPVPIGVSGELYISGLGLSKGYVNSPEKTSKVFITNPKNSDESLYRTGDLACYDKDGNIMFLGRADNQIKIRGFRVELQEIENTIKQLNEVNDAVITYETNGLHGKLSAFIKSSNTIDLDSVKSKLKYELPSYMIPNSVFRVEDFPYLPNGKIDKNKLKLEMPFLVSDEAKSKISDEPKTNIEKILVQLWQDVLEIPKIGITDNFFEIGGDSILSIQITAKAKKYGINIGSNQIFEHQTIAELAMFVSLNKTKEVNTNDFYGDIPLIPIQKWFFDTHKNAPEYWNQGFIITKLPTNTKKQLLREVTQEVIRNHAALRCSFLFKDSAWHAFVNEKENIEAFLVVDLTEEPRMNHSSYIESYLAKIQSSTNLAKGHLFKCIYFDTGNIDTDVMVLLAHHLVIDFVSWQIILNHYEDAIYENDYQISQTTSIKEWGTHLLELSKKTSLKNQIEYWKQQVVNNNLIPLDFKCELPILERDVDTTILEIDKKVSSNLVGKVHKAYNTKTDELLLVALVLTISKWTKNNEVVLALERHGRETTETSFDLSNTVGWLTSFFPKKLSIVNTVDLSENIIGIKEELRNIELGGIGYGILKHLSKELEDIEYPKIIFNYLGKQASSKLNYEFLSNNIRNPNSERNYYLEINVALRNESFIFNWSYANKAFKKETIDNLVNEYHKSLVQVVNHCLSVNTIKYTPSDFEDIDLDQDDLDTLFDSLNS